MFPFCCKPNTCYQTRTRDNYRNHQLEFLKMMRDHLEASLAAVNTAISTIEAQVQLTDNQEGDTAG